MSNQIIRQSDLFVAEDWRIVYQAFTDINFKNYSFDSVKASLIEYIRENYPEDFNDWTQNSEFLFIIDLLAYVSEIMSYRVDLNSRDNFIDVAERRESILRLARMINYNPNRNMPARGKVKIRSIRTNQIITDSEGRNLQNQLINWNDPSNPDWFEQFLLVLNSAFVSSNRFGNPIKTVTPLSGNPVSLYRINNKRRIDIAEKFTAAVAGDSMTFEVINPDLDNFGNVIERHPNPDAAKHILYYNDGSGNASPNTGFFLYFKQGRLKFQNYNFENALENRIVDIDVDNINEMDVWFSEVNENGSLINEWEKVPAVESTVYTSIDREIRNIFSVITRDDDQISLRFSDGRFGTAPKGLFRSWYRESNGLEYDIKPQEMRGKSISIPYRSNTGTSQDSIYNLNIVFDLEEPVRNSTPRETTDSIRNNAPRVFYTQNRMVNGEDYNSFPLSLSQDIFKLKSVNRIYSGQSPYIDNSDPTRRNQSTIEFGDDGVVYKENFNLSDVETFPIIRDNLEVVRDKILPIINNLASENFFYDQYRQEELFPSGNPGVLQSGYNWNVISKSPTTSSGYLTDNSSSDSILVGDNQSGNIKFIKEGSYLLFQELIPEDDNNPGNLDPDFIPKFKWARVINVDNEGEYENGDVGPILVDENITDQWKVIAVIPLYRQNLTEAELNNIADQIENNNTFGIRYDVDNNEWKIIDELNVSSVNTPFSRANEGATNDNNSDASWLIRVQYTSNEYIFVGRALRYVFESENITRFFFINEFRALDRERGVVNRDLISIFKFNKNLETNTDFQDDIEFFLSENIRYSDGYIEPRRVQVNPIDSDYDGSLDLPNAFNLLTDTEDNVDATNYIFQIRNEDRLGFTFYEITNKILSRNSFGGLFGYDWDTNADELLAGYNVQDGLFYKWDSDTQNMVEIDDQDEFRAFIGRRDLNYKYKHFSPEGNRIDPAITNVIDNYVMTNQYINQVEEWKNGNRLNPFPAPPLSEELQEQFSIADDFKMVTDQLLWNPAKFRLLFGEGSLPENRVEFRVVKIDNSDLTDNEIKQRILNAIEEYFDLSLWDFGEQVYTTELNAYIHQQLAKDIASIVIVPVQANQSGIRHPGDIYQIRLEFNELPLNTATVNDIRIVPAITNANVVR